MRRKEQRERDEKRKEVKRVQLVDDDVTSGTKRPEIIAWRVLINAQFGHSFFPRNEMNVTIRVVRMKRRPCTGRRAD